MLGMSMLADEEHLVGRFDEREHEVVEDRRQVDDDVTGDRLQRGADVRPSRRASSASVGIGSIGAGSTQQAAWPWSLRGERLHQLHVAVLHGRGGVEHGVSAAGGRASPTTSPNWRSPSTSTTGSVERFAIADGDVDRDAGLADATLGGEHRRSGGRAHRCAVAGACAPRVDARRRAARRRGRPTGGGWLRRRSRPRRAHRRAAPAGARRSRARRPRTRRRASGCAPVSRCTCWKPIGLAKPGPKTATTRPRRSAAGPASSIVSNCAAPASSTASRVRRIVRRARRPRRRSRQRSTAPGVDRGVATPPAYLVLARWRRWCRPLRPAELVGGSRTR